MSKAWFYAVARGNSVGVFDSWQKCFGSVNGFSGAKFKKFPTIEQAKEYVQEYREMGVNKIITKKGLGRPLRPNSNAKNGNCIAKSPKKPLRSTVSGNGAPSLEVELKANFDDSVTVMNYGIIWPEMGVNKIITKKGLGRPLHPNSNAKMGNCIAKSPKKPLRSTVSGNGAPSLEVELKANFDDSVSVVYTDGACSRNGLVGAKAGFGVFWADGHPDNVSAPVIGSPTNNRAEYLAVITAIEKVIERNIRRLVIRTDSEILIKSMGWLPKWRSNKWKTISGIDIKNRDLLERLDKLVKSIDVKFEKVAGHSGNYGNDQADHLAREGAKMYIAENTNPKTRNKTL